MKLLRVLPAERQMGLVWPITDCEAAFSGPPRGQPLQHPSLERAMVGKASASMALQLALNLAAGRKCRVVRTIVSQCEQRE